MDEARVAMRNNIIMFEFSIKMLVNSGVLINACNLSVASVELVTASFEMMGPIFSSGFAAMAAVACLIVASKVEFTCAFSSLLKLTVTLVALVANTFHVFFVGNHFAFSGFASMCDCPRSMSRASAFAHAT